MSYDTSITPVALSKAESPSNGMQSTTTQEEENYFSSLENNKNGVEITEDSDTVEIQNPQTKEEKLAYIYSNYQKSKDEQGIIGKVSNGFKNLFHTKNSPNNIEKAIANLNENSTDEEINAVMEQIKKYDSNQDTVVKTTATTGSMIAGGAVGAKAGAALGTAIFPGLGTAAGLVVGMAVGALVGAVTSIGINQIENMTDNVKGNSWQNDENLLKEGAQGAVAGASAVAMGAVTKAVKGAVAAKAGLESVEVGGKTIMVALAEDGTAKVGETVAKTAIANAAGTAAGSVIVADAEYMADVVLDDEKEFSAVDLATTTLVSGTIGGAFGAVSGSIEGRIAANTLNKAVNPYNIARSATAEEVGRMADKEIGNKQHRVATAGYSAAPEGYEQSTKDFISALDKELGTDSTAFVTSPTADKGSIDAITSEVTGLKKGKIFYTTAEGYVKYINPDNFPETIDADTYARLTKHVLPNGAEYSRATAEASNAFVATGGRNATVSDFINATNKGNKAIILNNSGVNAPAWDAAKNRVGNASRYIAEQLEAFSNGQPLPYPEVEGFTQEFLSQNASKLSDLVQVVETDGTSRSVQEAARQAARFLKSTITYSQLESEVFSRHPFVYTLTKTDLDKMLDSGCFSQSYINDLISQIESNGYT